MPKETFINSFGEKMTREQPKQADDDDSNRISVGKFGILCAHWISQCPKELHEPLIQILLSISNGGDYDEQHHLRRCIEVNISRQEEKFIKQVVKGAAELLKLHFEENIDCNIQIGILKDVAMCKSITRERMLSEKRKARKEAKH
jgi:hypothetical protein